MTAKPSWPYLDISILANSGHARFLLGDPAFHTPLVARQWAKRNYPDGKVTGDPKRAPRLD